MKRVLGAALGVFTAIGGFMDIMVWVTVVAVIGITAYSEMAGRVADRPSRRWSGTVLPQ